MSRQQQEQLGSIGGAAVNDLPVLIARIRNGDSAAFELVVRYFQDMAVGYSFVQLGDYQLAEDAAQEAFIAAYFDLDSLNEPAAFPGWFRRIVLKQIDRIRRKRRPVVGIEQIEEVRAKQSDPAELIEEKELCAVVSSAILALPETQREVVTLYYMGEYSQRAISEFLAIPLSTVKMRLFHARRRLKTQLTSLVIDYLPSQRPSRNQSFMEKIMSYQVQTKQVPAQKILSVTRHAGTRDLQAHLDGGVKTLTVYAQTLRVQITGLPMAIYHGPVHQEQGGVVEICLPVAGDVEPSFEIAVKELPATQVAATVTTLRQSIFPGVVKAYAAIEQWIAQQGHQVAGPPREIYLNFNHSIFSPTASLDDLCLEVVWLYQ